MVLSVELVIEQILKRLILCYKLVCALSLEEKKRAQVLEALNALNLYCYDDTKLI